jgi:arylsulfatase A-like enzyme
VVTDNGKYRAGKGTLYEGGVRVAACVAWDGHIKPGTAITEPMHAVDWYPTLLKLCGADPAQSLPVDGLDIWPVLTEGKPSPHEAILLNTTPRVGAIRAGDWKLVVKNGADDPDGGPPRNPERKSVELFNLRDDPYEKTNLAEANPDKLKELQDKLNTFAEQAAPPKSRPKPNGFVVPKVWGEKD